MHVSILAQPEGRALPQETTPTACSSQMFQSSPNPKVGRYISSSLAMMAVSSFQSSPNPKVGRYIEEPVTYRMGFKFQSSPNPKVGRYRYTGSATP